MCNCNINNSRSIVLFGSDPNGLSMDRCSAEGRTPVYTFRCPGRARPYNVHKYCKVVTPGMQHNSAYHFWPSTLQEKQEWRHHPASIQTAINSVVGTTFELSLDDYFDRLSAIHQSLDDCDIINIHSDDDDNDDDDNDGDDNDGDNDTHHSPMKKQKVDVSLSVSASDVFDDNTSDCDL